MSSGKLAAGGLTIIAIAVAACTQGETAAGPGSATVNVTPSTPPSAQALPTGAYPTPVFINNADCAGVSRKTPDVREVTIAGRGAGVSVLAETASTDGERRQGLMCRESIAPGTGMLFLFQQPTTGGFWMFNTYVPLDILYIGKDGRVVSAARMQPCLRRQDEHDAAWRDRCATESVSYRPSAMYTAAIELPAGWLEDNAVPGLAEAGSLTITWQ